MPIDPNDRVAILQREERVWDLLGQGQTNLEVAAALGIDFRIVSRIRKRVERRVLAEMTKHVERTRARQLGKVGWAQRQAVKGWQESCKPAAKSKRRTVTATAGATPTPISEENEIKGQSGNPAFLTTFARLVEVEAELTGTMAPVKVAPTNVAGDAPYQPPALQDAHRRFDEIIAGVFARLQAQPKQVGEGQTAAAAEVDS